MRFLSSSVSAASIVLAGVLLLSPSQSVASPWLAPAADERITADWVKDVARAFDKHHFKNVFMNQQYGCDQCRILGFLNRAAEALENDQPKLAKSFIHRALGVLDRGEDRGWYTEEDTQPIRRLIINKANEGLQDADAPRLALAPPPEERRDSRYDRGRDPLFKGPGESESRRGRADVSSGYGERHRLEDGRYQDRRDREAMKSRDREGQMAMERDYYDESYSQDRPRRGQQDRMSRERGTSSEKKTESRMSRRGRDRFPEEMTAQDALETVMKGDEEEQSEYQGY
jgi:hypothetical protein